MRVFTTTVVLFVLSYSQAAGAQEVTACEARAIPTLGGTHVHANDLNERGHVVGRSSVANDTNEHAFSWQRGRAVDLGSLAADADSAATAINDSGLIVGYSAETRGGDPVPVVWGSNGIRQLRFSGTSGVAVDVNNRGQIVGNQGFSECLLWRNANSEPIVLGGLGGTFCLATSINDQGVVVGTATTGSGDTRAFVWRDGVLREAESIADPPGGYSFSELLDINSAGLAVGRLQTEGLVARPFVWTSRGGGRTLDVADSVAAAVNDRGVIAIVQELEMSSLWIAGSRGRAESIGTLGGSVSYDDLAINDRSQIAWTVLAGEPLRFQAYRCQLERR